MLFLEINDPDSYNILSEAISSQNSGHPRVEVVPISNGSVYSYLPLLAFAWMKYLELADDCTLMLRLLDCEFGREQYRLEDIITCVTSIDETITCDLSHDFIGVENVNYLASLLNRSEMLNIKVMTLVTPRGDVYMGYSSIRLYFRSIEDGYALPSVY